MKLHTAGEDYLEAVLILQKKLGMEKKTGIKITPHMLRRYYANTRWEADWPLEMISQALGHKHLDTTIRYLNVLDDKLKTASQEFYRRYSKLYGVEQFLESRR